MFNMIYEAEKDFTAEQREKITSELKKALEYNIDEWLVDEIHCVLEDPTTEKIVWLYNNYWEGSLFYLDVTSLLDV